ncbi:MAG: hypothetical protein MR717_08205 [Prevotella sp.]|nr:hypothetical protein [Prevotella sp.]
MCRDGVSCDCCRTSTAICVAASRDAPSAVPQRYHKILDEVIIPYFRRNYDTNGNEIAPLFVKAAEVENISLPDDFWEEI